MQAAVSNWLRSVLGPYTHRDIVFSHVDTLLRTFTALSPRTSSYTHDDGRTQILLCCHGTIPVIFKGNSYNIPIALWIPFDYPRGLPIVYVVPTSSMLVRPSRNIEVSGRCMGDYLTGWARKPEGCNLVELCRSLQALFAREPPVYAKPQSQVSQSPLASPTLNPSPSPAYRPAPKPPVASSSPVSSDSSKPVLPLRPSSSGSGRLPSRPPLPPTPSTNSAPPRPTTSMLPVPQQIGYRSPPPAPREDPYFTSPPRSDHPPLLATPAQTLPQQQPSRSQSAPAPHATMPFTSSKTPIMNLLDEDDTETAATRESVQPTRPSSTGGPIRPANPELVHLRSAVSEKLSRALQDYERRHESECAQLVALNQDLKKGEPAIMDEMQRLEVVKNLCLHVGERYRQTLEQIQSNVDTLKQKDVGSVDEIVCSTTVVYNQLLELIAEDNAIEDSIYQLGRSLNSDTARIDLDKFLKRVRSLAKDQFYKRALINKILLNMALAPSYPETSQHQQLQT